MVATSLHIPLRLLLSLMLLGPLGASGIDKEALDQAMHDLAHADFSTREAATHLLWKHVEEAQAQIQSALQSQDPDQRARAERIDQAYQLGIFPDTPAEVARRIYEFHDGDLQQKRQILEQLVSSDDLGTAYRLLSSVDDDGLREDLAQGLAARIRAKLLPSLLTEDWDLAGNLLKRAALGREGMRDYAVFAQRTGKTDDALTETANTSHGTLLKTWLLRAADRKEESLTLAKNDPDLQRELHSAYGDALAFCEDHLASQTLEPEQKAHYRAFQARLTGNQATLAGAVKDLIDLAKVMVDFNQRAPVDALLLIGVIDPILPHLPKGSGQSAYDIQSYRGLYAGALETLGIEKQTPPFEKWVTEKADRIQKDAEDPAFEELLQFADHLFDMGHEDEAKRLHQAAYEATAGATERQHEIIREEMRLGLLDVVENRFRSLAETMSIDELMATFMVYPHIVKQWYDYFIKVEKEAKPRLDTLFQAWRLVNVPEGKALPPGEIDPLLDSAFQDCPKEGRQSTDYLRNLYVTAAAHERHEKALLYLVELEKLTPEDNWTYYIAETQSALERWADAAESYEKIWQQHIKDVQTSLVQNDNQARNTQTLQPSHLYRAGHAFVKAGEIEKGTQMIEQASLLCLGDLTARYALASVMDQAGDKEAAQKEWALMARLSTPEDPLGTLAFLNLADVYSKTDFKQAIRYQERVMVARHHLRSDLPYAFIIRMQSQWCLWTALAAFEDGDTEAALKAIQAYSDLTPGNASIGEVLLPKLEEAGKTAEALALYDRTRALSLEACEIFPKSAMAHNNLAWLDARSRRKLDEALKNAMLANELKPETAAYLDTLAEVHFVLGDRAKALELSDVAIKLLPDDDELIGQRARFENAPLPEKRPADE